MHWKQTGRCRPHYNDSQAEVITGNNRELTSCLTAIFRFLQVLHPFDLPATPTMAESWSTIVEVGHVGTQIHGVEYSGNTLVRQVKFP